MDFQTLFSKYKWQEIKNCSGRYKLLQKGISLEDLLGSSYVEKVFESEKARDLVVVEQIEGGGILSYKKADGSYLHTLNNIEGLNRKLADLGIKL